MSHSDAIDVVLAYHERTKHHVGRYARSLGYLDWSTQPDPFRRFERTTPVLLDEIEPTSTPSFDALFDGPLSPPHPLDRAFVSQLFYDALALSAWKETPGSRWSLRVNPSSGNLHPTEGYFAAPAIDGLFDAAAVFHYGPYRHALEPRLTLSSESWNAIAEGLPRGAVLVGLTSIHWREAWKYGERAFRYCQHDVGHAIAAITISAGALGWRTRLVDSVTTAELASLLGTDRQSGPEAEHADCLLMLWPHDWTLPDAPFRLPQLALDDVRGQQPSAPLPLSPDHMRWDVIDEVAGASVVASVPSVLSPAGAPFERSPLVDPRPRSGRAVIRGRRSAVDMDGLTGMSKDAFLRLLARTMPSSNPTVFAALPWSPAVHLAIFVHRVDGLEPGLYLLVRNDADMAVLKSAMSPDFEWTKIGDLPLWRLVVADAQRAARGVSCGQEIAADGAFSLGMIARFEPELRTLGASMYPRLFWETGAIGQVLYLEAEAAGLRGTGIGCFFDDSMHELLGLADRQFQSLYHFTIGEPVEDTRLRTAPAYAHRGVE